MHAQHAGAVGVIMINANEQRNLFLMGDDRSARPVQIPSLMIDRTNGKHLKKCLVTAQDYYEQRQKHPSAYNTADVTDKGALRIELVRMPVPLGRSTYTSVGALASGHNYHVSLRGNSTHFLLSAMGGATVEVTEQNKAYMLRIY